MNFLTWAFNWRKDMLLSQIFYHSAYWLGLVGLYEEMAFSFQFWMSLSIWSLYSPKCNNDNSMFCLCDLFFVGRLCSLLCVAVLWSNHCVSLGHYTFIWIVLVQVCFIKVVRYMFCCLYANWVALLDQTCFHFCKFIFFPPFQCLYCWFQVCKDHDVWYIAIIFLLNIIFLDMFIA